MSDSLVFSEKVIKAAHNSTLNAIGGEVFYFSILFLHLVFVVNDYLVLFYHQQH